MATGFHEATDTNVTELIKGIVADGQELLEKHLEILTAEVKADWERTKQAATLLAVGIAPLLIGVVLLGFMLVYLVHWATAPAGYDPASVPLWACYGIVGVVLCLVGGGLIYAGIRRFQAFNPLPDETARAFKENLRWLTEHRPPLTR